MDTDYTLVPPPELVQKWVAEIWHEGTPVQVAASDVHIATRAAQWGADQELKACVAWLNESWEGIAAARLHAARHAARRPKPSSLKQQALTLIGHLDDDALATIRRALEQLDD